ncbi:MAG: hypothetical protein U0231_10485 [Nitrospiraceae bacterium]
MDNAQVSQAPKSQPEILPAVTPAIPIAATAVATRISDVLHDDIFFEIGRKGLTDDGKAALLNMPNSSNRRPTGACSCRAIPTSRARRTKVKILGRSARMAQPQLMALMSRETAIRTVSLGEGALYVDQSDARWRMNRRVHLESAQDRVDHMVIPTVAAAPADLDNQPSSAPRILGVDYRHRRQPTLLHTDFRDRGTSADVPESDSAH